MLDIHAKHLKSAASEKGFTLPELVIVVVLLGILAAIAIPSFFGLVTSNNATAAANQVAADLRLSSSQAMNRLTTWRFEVLANGSYRMGRPGSLVTRTLPKDAKLTPQISMNFRASGEVRKSNGTTFSDTQTITVNDSRGDPAYDIHINPQTSRIKIEPR